MAVTVTRPSGRRADDARALRLRFRTLTFSGSYATGGETITAQSVSLKRILAVIPADGVIAPAATATGSLYKIDVASDGRSVVIRFLNDAAGAAAATLGQEKTAGAHVAGSKLDVIIIGE